VSALQGVVNKLRLLIPRLGSDYDGEVVATVRQIRKTLQGAGLDLHDLAEDIDKPPKIVTIPAPSHDAPEYDWQALIYDCLQIPESLTDRENGLSWRACANGEETRRPNRGSGCLRFTTRFSEDRHDPR